MKSFKELIKSIAKLFRLKKIPTLLKNRTLIQFGVPNADGVIYEKDNLGEFNDVINKSNQMRLLGELDHPNIFEISLGRVSHLIKNIQVNESDVKADVLVLTTYQGDILKSLINAGIQFEFAPRASGIKREDGTIDVKEIYTFDAVPKKK